MHLSVVLQVVFDQESTGQENK